MTLRPTGGGFRRLILGSILAGRHRGLARCEGLRGRRNSRALRRGVWKSDLVVTDQASSASRRKLYSAGRSDHHKDHPQKLLRRWYLVQ